MPKIVDRELYRQELLNLSFELFATKGYGKITMRQLAEGMGVSTGTLYHYFPSKEVMFIQLVEEQTQRDIASFLAQTESVPANLHARVSALFDFVTENRDYFLKQTIVWMDYFQQHGTEETRVNETLDKAWIETIKAIDNFLEINDRNISEFAIIFLNGLMICQLSQPNLIHWEIQGKLLAEAIIGMIETK
jgi:AcrR family transcriptional regulator